MIQKIKCFFGFHKFKWEKDATEIFLSSDNLVIAYVFSCKHCGKEERRGDL